MMLLKPPAARAAKLLIVMVFVAAAWSAFHPALERWTPAMKQTVLASDTMRKRPLIDRQAPKQVATATFALG
jgi:hypothetical protein